MTKARFGPNRATEWDTGGTGSTEQQKLPTFEGGKPKMRPILAAAIALVLIGCGREEEPVADRFDRQKAEIENKARVLEALVENEVSAAEARLGNEADELRNSFEARDEAVGNASGNGSSEAE